MASYQASPAITIWWKEPRAPKPDSALSVPLCSLCYLLFNCIDTASDCPGVSIAPCCSVNAAFLLAEPGVLVVLSCARASCKASSTTAHCQGASQKAHHNGVLSCKDSWRRGRNDLRIKCRLARRRDEAADFASRSAGIGTGTIEAEVLDDLSGGRICRAVVGAIPAWIRVECFGLKQQ